ncbi:MAG: hypothetical protein ACYCX1_13430, partial [Bellilinea sp.]
SDAMTKLLSWRGTKPSAPVSKHGRPWKGILGAPARIASSAALCRNDKIIVMAMNEAICA